MYIGYDSVLANDVARNNSLLNIPANAVGAMVRATTAAVRYTCDGVTDPTTSLGMILRVADPPFHMLIEDLVRIRFCRDGATDGELLVQYYGPRDTFPDNSVTVVDGPIAIDFLAGFPRPW